MTITTDHERMELDWLASLKALARSLISWISVSVNNELNVAENFGASLLDTSSISIMPLLSSFISTAASCLVPSSTPTKLRYMISEETYALGVQAIIPIPSRPIPLLNRFVDAYKNQHPTTFNCSRPQLFADPNLTSSFFGAVGKTSRFPCGFTFERVSSSFLWVVTTKASRTVNPWL